MAQISVLIATLNRAEHLHKCLLQLFKSEPFIAEIIIIDQSDNDETRQLVEQFKDLSIPLIYKRIATKGKAQALNQGILIAQGEFLAFTDDDCIPAENWLAAFDNTRQQFPDVHAFCGAVHPENNSDPQNYLNLVLDKKIKFLEPQKDPIHPGLPGGNVIIRRRVLCEIGLFNHYFGPGAMFRSNIDGELAYRLYKHSYQTLFSPNIKIEHSDWRNDADNHRLKFDYAYGLGAFAAYYLVQHDSLPLRRLLVIFLQKIRRFLLGLCLFQKHRILDGSVHVQGFFLGLFKGWWFFRNQDIKP